MGLVANLMEKILTKLIAIEKPWFCVLSGFSRVKIFYSGGCNCGMAQISVKITGLENKIQFTLTLSFSLCGIHLVNMLISLR